jgi:hypothetical protein
MATQASSRAPARSIGLLLVLAGLAVNAQSAGWYLASDQYIDKPAQRTAILVLQGVLGLIGLALILGWRGLPASRGLRGLATIVLLGVVVGGAWGTGRARGMFASDFEKEQASEITRMYDSEAVHLNLTPRFKLLANSAKNLHVPDVGSRELFTEEVTVVDVAESQGGHQHEMPLVATRFEAYALEPGPHAVRRDALDLMRSVLDQVEYFEHTKFGFKWGDFLPDDNGGWDYHRWRVEGFFGGLAKLKNGDMGQVKGNCFVTWNLDADADAADKEQFNDSKRWRISELSFVDFKIVRSPFKLFSEELERAVVEPEAVAEARHNNNRRYLEAKLQADLEKKPWTPPHPKYYDFKAAYVLPTASVIDIDRDGHDDFYKLQQYGKNQFFHNRGDGTFEEDAAERGLDVADYCNVACFADFDNDGDPDLFLGRSLEPSKFLVNEGGKFVEKNELFGMPSMPSFVATASCADYDMDGLLDLYVGTYAAQVVVRDLSKRDKLGGKVMADYLPEHQARKLYELGVAYMENPIRDRVGPPNILLHNAGDGRLEWVEDTPLTLYRNTFQATWADFDGDGDPDVYASNDFSLNNLFVNQGNGVFEDVTERTQSGDVGFGMGVSWGDHDRDGDQDMYVSNMYSKAGSRILPRVPGIDRRFLDMAKGNSLLSWNGATFDKASSQDPKSGLMVEIAGWSWGSQYLDVNNDSWLDLYVLNGYYSAPKKYEDPVDL